MAFITPVLLNDVNRRLAEHNEGISITCYTYKRRPVVLRYAAHLPMFCKSLLTKRISEDEAGQRRKR
jgi:hypothetical protein